MLKTVGSVMILCSAGAIGMIFAGRIKESELWLKEIKLVIIRLTGEIRYHRKTVPEALCTVGRRYEGRLKEFLTETGEQLQEMESGSLQEVWKHNGEQILQQAPLTREQKEAFLELGSFFCEADETTRTGTIDFYLLRLEEELKELRKNGKEKAYLYRMLGVMGGMFLLILVL